MCNQAEWDKLRRRAEDAFASEDLRELMSEAAARVEALIDEIKVWAFAPEDAECFRRRQRRPRSEWVV
jgi:S-adenosylmethionine/arginine decarboxylase-like enzyme